MSRRTTECFSCSVLSTRGGVSKAIGFLAKIAGTVLAIFVFLGPVQAWAQNPDWSAQKISPWLSVHQAEKENPGGLTPQQHRTRLTGMGLNAGNLLGERCALYMNRRLNGTEIQDLAGQGIVVDENNWVPPVPGKHPYGFHLVTVPYASLDVIRNDTRFVYLESTEFQDQPMNDLGGDMIGATDVRAGIGVDPPRDGSGVRIAVADSGIDPTHPDLPTPVEAFDMTDGTSPADWGTDVSATVDDHGTHVSGSALGSGGLSGGKYVGSAPGADFYFYKIGNDTNAGATGDDEIEAINRALTVGCDIFSMSYGGTSTYQDGSGPVAQAVDAAFAAGMVCFISAGNEAGADDHFSVNVSPGTTSGSFGFSVQNGTGAPFAPGFVIPLAVQWIDGVSDANITLNLLNPGAGETLTETMSGTSARGTEAKWYVLHPNLVNGATKTYSFSFTNSAGGGSTPRVHVTRPSGWPGVTDGFTNPDPSYTVTSPALADDALAVGAWTQRRTWRDYTGAQQLASAFTVNTLAPFSSRGPRLDGAMKPTFVAPGAVTISARARGNNINTGQPLAGRTEWIIDNDGFNLNGSGPADYYIKAGTSMACPLAAGAAALLLQGDPGLTPSQIRDAISSTASQAGSPDNNAGYGLIDIKTAILESLPPVDCTVVLDAAAVSHQACVGGETSTGITIINNSSFGLDLSAVCTLDGQPLPPGSFSISPHLNPGESGGISATFLCQVVGSPAIECTVTAVSDDGRGCTDTFSFGLPAQCVEGCVEILAGNVESCLGETALVTATVTNCSSTFASIDVSYTVNGAVNTLPQFLLDPGQSQDVTASVLCEQLGTLDVVFDVEATANYAIIACTAVGTATATVTCREFCNCPDISLAFAAVSHQACVGDDTGSGVDITNTSDGALDLSVTCTLDGIPVPGGAVNFPPSLDPGETGAIQALFTCAEAGAPDLQCVVTATRQDNPDCVLTETIPLPAECVGACVEIDIESEVVEACVGGAAFGAGTVTNCSTRSAQVVLTLRLDGVDAGSSVLVFDPGQTVSYSIELPCDAALVADMEIEAVATVQAALVACSASATVQGQFICHESSVVLEAQGGSSCVGTPFDVLTTVRNTSSGPANLVVRCYVNGTPSVVENFPGVPPGETRTITVTIPCDEAGTSEVFCTATVTDGVEGCIGNAEATATVTCFEPCLFMGSVTSVDACVGDAFTIPVSMTNCSGGPEDISFNCTVNGVPLPPLVFGAVPAGATVTHEVPVVCEAAGSFMVRCDAQAYPVGSAECGAQGSRWITVLCKEACVDLLVGEGGGCLGSNLDLPVYLTNCSSEPANLTLTCLVNGVPEAEWLFEGIAPGERIEEVLWLMCETSETQEVECVATATLVDSPQCTATESSAVTVTCPVVCADIVVATAGAPLGENILVPVVVLNCSSGPADLTVVCAVDQGIDPDPVTFENVAPGEVRTLSVPVFCSWGGVTVTCTVSASLVSRPVCRTEVTSVAQVACFEPDVTSEGLGPAAGCVGSQILIPMTVKNVSTGMEDISVNYAAGEIAYPPVTMTEVPAGESREVQLSVAGAEPGVTAVSVTTSAWATGYPEVTAEITGETTATAHVPGVQVAAEDATACLGQTLVFPVAVTNTSTGAADVVVNVSLGGASLDPVTFADVPAGETRTAVVSILEQEEGELELACTVSLTLSDSPGCGVETTDTAVITCRTCAALAAGDVVPGHVTLRAYPNPVLARGTVIEYTVPEHLSDRAVQLSVYDVRGRLVRDLVSGTMPTGRHAVTWNLRDGGGGEVPAGLYFYRVRVGSEQRTERLLVIRQ